MYSSIINRDKICINDNLKNSDQDLGPELEYFLEKNIFRVFVDYCCFKNLELIRIIVPVVERIITEIKNEMFLMNSAVISSIKVLVVALISLVKQCFIDTKNNPNLQADISTIVEFVISFTFVLLNKIIIYPNFYASISVCEERGKYFDTVIFDLVVELFSKEFMITKREIKSKIRKSILLCLNLDNFYSEMNIKDIDSLIQGLIKNLVEYYEIFINNQTLSLSNKSPYKVNKLKKRKELMKKEKISIEMLENLINDDIKSYLKFISIIVYCFSDIKFKLFITKIFFQNFLIQCLQKDILNETNVIKVFEFIFYITSIIKNKEISDKIFEFFFGISNNESLIYVEGNFSLLLDNNYEIEEESIIDIKKSMIEGLADSDSDQFNTNNNNFMVDNKKNEKIIQKLIKKDNSNPNFNEAIKFEIDKIEKENHKYEDIIALFTKFIESNQTDLKILIINCLNNIIQNSSKLFLTEMLLPYYKNSIQHININELMVQYLLNSYEKIDIVEIIKQVQPSNINLNLDKWSEYFDLILESTYKKNIFLINHLSNKSENDFKNIDLTSQIFNKNELKNLNSTLIEEKNSYSTLSDPNNFSNDLKLKDVRTMFFEVLVKSFKNFIHNKYKENLFLTKLFLTIFSIPNVVALNENDFNLYNNVNFSTNKKANYNFLSSVYLISHIWLNIQNQIKINKYDKIVVSKWVSDRYKEKELMLELDLNNKKNEKKKQNFKVDDSKLEFIDNIILFVEFYKEFVAIIYMKCQFDFTSRNYSKCLTNNFK